MSVDAKPPRAPRAARTADDMAKSLSSVALPKKDKARESIQNLKFIEDTRKALDAEWKELFNKICQTEGIIEKEEIERRFRCIIGKAGTKQLGPSHWTASDEFWHRMNFLKRANGAQHKLHFGHVGGVDFDTNLDKHYDFILRPEDNGTLKALTYDELLGTEGRLNFNKVESIMNADDVFEYVCSGRVQRRTFWCKANKVEEYEEKRVLRDEKGNPTGKGRDIQAKANSYASIDLHEADRNTTDFGWHEYYSNTFEPWVPVHSSDLEPFRPVLKLLSKFVRLSNEKKVWGDRTSRSVSTPNQRPSDPDRKWALSQSSFHPIAKKSCSVNVAALTAGLTVQHQQICNRISEIKFKYFTDSWDCLVRLSGLGLPKCMNSVWNITRSLHNSNAVVFRDPDNCLYDAKSTAKYRSLDDHLSYADDRLISLVLEYGLCDADAETIDPITDCKVFMSESMRKDHATSYSLPPYAFVFNTQTHLLKLVSASTLFRHYRQLYYEVETIITELSSCMPYSMEEVSRRRGDPDDPIYGDEPLHPLILPFVNFHHEVSDLRFRNRRFKRASFEDTLDKTFPFPTRIFVDAIFPVDSLRIVSDGRDIFAYYPGIGWQKQLSLDDESEVEVGTQPTE